MCDELGRLGPGKRDDHRIHDPVLIVKCERTEGISRIPLDLDTVPSADDRIIIHPRNISRHEHSRIHLKDRGGPVEHADRDLLRSAFICHKFFGCDADLAGDIFYRNLKNIPEFPDSFGNLLDIFVHVRINLLL